MEWILRLREIAEEICELMVACGDWSASTDVDKLARALTSRPHRKAYAGMLKSVAEWDENDEYAYKASMLYRELEGRV